jgi:hypothetical protein
MTPQAFFGDLQWTLAPDRQYLKEAHLVGFHFRRTRTETNLNTLDARQGRPKMLKMIVTL